jgi:hypothetical protein
MALQTPSTSTSREEMNHQDVQKSSTIYPQPHPCIFGIYRVPFALSPKNWGQKRLFLTINIPTTMTIYMKYYKHVKKIFDKNP